MRHADEASPQAARCQFCDAPMGVSRLSGRVRQYCSDTCRKAASRKRQRGKRLAAAPVVATRETLPRPAPRLLLAGVDNINFSFDDEVSDDIWNKLSEERDEARLLEQRKAAHCPDWLDARIFPTGARGGYRFLIDKEDKFSMKLLRGVPNRPAIVVEMHAYGLHTHAGGVLGALAEAFTYIGTTLFPEITAAGVMERFTLDTAKCGRLDLHADWQGGDTPKMHETEEDDFIHAGAVKVNRRSQGRHCTGYTFGHTAVQGRLYNKTVQAKGEKLDWYFELLRQVNGPAYDEALDVWRMEFQLMRDGIKGFRLYTTPQDTDDDDVITAELAAEDLPHIGSVRRALQWSSEVWRYMTGHWLRWATPTASTNRASWPLRESWQVVQHAFDAKAVQLVVPDDKLQLVRAQRHTGYARAMHRLAAGLITAMEVMDVDPGAAQVAYLEHMARVAELAQAAQMKRLGACDEDERRAVRVLQGMGVRESKIGDFRQLVDMAVGVFTSVGVLKLNIPDERQTMVDLLLEVIDDIERVAQEKGGVPLLTRDKGISASRWRPHISRFDHCQRCNSVPNLVAVREVEVPQVRIPLPLLVKREVY